MTSILLSIALLLNIHALASQKCIDLYSNSSEQVPYRVEVLNSASSRLFLLAGEGKLLNQHNPKLEEMGLISNSAGAGLCTTACAVNSLIALANPYLKSTAAIDKNYLAKRFVEIAERFFPGVDPRLGFDLEKIERPLLILGSELGLNLRVSSKLIGDKGLIGLEDFYESKANELVLLSIWVGGFTHAISLVEVDPVSRRARIIDPNLPDFVQKAVVFPGRFEGMPTEKMEFPVRGAPKHPDNGSILKVVKISIVDAKAVTAEDYKPKETKTLGGPRTDSAQTKEPIEPTKPQIDLVKKVDAPSEPVNANDTTKRVDALVSRLQFFKQGQGERVPIDFTNDVDLIYFIPSDSAVTLSKGLLNQHQTQRSNGSFAPDARKKNEDLLMGFDVGYDAEALNFRPKSTYLNIRNENNYGYFTDNMVSHYGGVGVVLKNRMKRQSIWAAEDSFDLLSHATSSNDSKILSRFGGFNETALPKSEGLYLEALTFGKIELDDVDHLLVLNKDMVASLKHLGLPIYYMEIQRKSGRYIFFKGEKLF